LQQPWGLIQTVAYCKGIYEGVNVNQLIPTDDKIIPSVNDSSEALKVMLVTEGTYPFHWGGVSTWCHLLIRDLPEVNFTVLSIAADPHIKPQITLLDNVVDFRPIPLWGIREATELNQNLSLVEVFKNKQHSSEEIVAEKFVPIFSNFIRDLFISDSEPELLGEYIHKMYRFFLEHNFDTVMHSKAVWNSFIEAVQQNFPQAAAHYGYPNAEFALLDITTSLQWLYHWFFPLANPLPKVDVTHTSMAGISTMIGIVTKLEYGTAFLLSEHGIYLRERYLEEAQSSGSLFLKLFKLRFARRMTDLSYASSDQISPCCDYNQRWELQSGATKARLKTIYYGADDQKFYAAGKPIGEPPVVVWVGRINPLKDVITLLKAAALVHASRPDIKFRLYGSPPPEDIPYYEECKALQSSLGLEEAVIFAGYSSNTAEAYNEGDVVVLSSISEGFPFATLEAMLCGKPIVATSVGGIPEQIAGCGFVVEPRNPKEMADAILKLMNDKELCAKLGVAAREKALQEFSVRQSREAYMTSYYRIANRTMPEALFAARVETKIPLLIEVALAEALMLMPSGGESGLMVNLNDGSMIPSFELNENNEEEFDAPSDLNEHRVVSQLILTGSSFLSETNNSYPESNITGEVVEKFHFENTPNSSDNSQEIAAEPGQMELTLEMVRIMADEVMRHCPQPIDFLEVTAIIESFGTTDDIARHQYGASDTFALAKAVLAIIREEHPIMGGVARKEHTEPISNFRQKLMLYTSGPITLLPGLIVMSIIQFYAISGQFTSEQMLALSMGISTGLLLTNGFLQAIMRRTSICLSLNNPTSARKFLIRSLSMAALAVIGLGMTTILLTSCFNVYTFEDRILFCLGYIGISIIWLVGGALSPLKAQLWLGIGLITGLGTIIATDFLTGIFLSEHLIVSTIAGIIVTLGVIFYAIKRAFAKIRKSVKKDREILPSNTYLLYEAVPYFTYGMFYVAFITAPHFLGWLGKVSGDQSRSWAIVSLELGLTLALPPLILVGGFAERTVRMFWEEAGVAQANTSGLAVDQFGRKLLDFYWQQRRHYSNALFVVSIIFAIPISLLIRFGIFSAWLGLNSDAILIFFIAGLVSYYWLGQGLFNCMFSLTLARPIVAVRAVVVGMIVMLALGIPLTLNVDFKYCLAAFIAGSLAFVISSSRLTQKVLASADYYYYAAA
jgi:glycosyltransferase involved in cell wall biosynthesis